MYITGGDETSTVPLTGDRLLHLRADGVQVPRHTGAPRGCTAPLAPLGYSAHQRSSPPPHRQPPR